MTIAELIDEVVDVMDREANELTSNPGYDVVIDLGREAGITEVKSLRWDHTDKQLVIEF